MQVVQNFTGGGSGIYIGNDDLETKGGTNKHDFQASAANGKIDTAFEQSKLNDCALLSTVFSISQTEQGAKDIEHAIKINKDGSYDVTFKGTGETYHISAKELSDAKRGLAKNPDGTARWYSWGDDDMTILELAMEKAFTDSKNTDLRHLVDDYTDQNKVDKLNYVNPASVSFLLTGEKTEWYSSRGLTETYAVNEEYTTTDINGKKVTLSPDSYYKLSKDGKNIEVFDPQTGNKIVIDATKFLQDVGNPDKEADIADTRAALENFDPKKTIIVFGVGSNPKGNVVKGQNGRDVQLSSEAHAYSVKEVKDGIVTLVNPQDTRGEIKCTLESLLKLSKFNCYTTDINQQQEPVYKSIKDLIPVGPQKPDFKPFGLMLNFAA